MRGFFLGLISGTSVDEVDAAIASFHGGKGTVRLVGTHAHPIPPRLKRDLLSIAAAERTTFNRVARLDVEVGELFSDAALGALEASGTTPAEVAAIGSHGQTIRHEPHGRWPFSTQIGDPNVIAERTGITTVADFRRRDVAAGGQGAPLAPMFHEAVLSHPTRHRVVVNLGGIANVSILQPATGGSGELIGFDCGPANGLLDAWSRRHLSLPFDRGGDWAAQGKVDTRLLQRMLADPYFARAGPKSTGRGYFDEGWIDAHVRASGARPAPVDVQRTLCELCAATVQQAIDTGPARGADVFLCGGGVHNRTLFESLRARLAPRPVAATDALGAPADYVEALTFAWLAMRTLEGRSGNRPSVTGARKAVVLGGIYPGVSR